MKPREERIRGLLAEWLGKAEADMGVAQHLLSEATVYANAIAFHCQQAAEKYLKAFLVWNQVAFPKTHDLEDLLDLVAPTDKLLAASLRDVIVLTPYGVEIRYPGDRPDARPDDARQAFALARQVRDAVLAALPPDLRRET